MQKILGFLVLLSLFMNFGVHAAEQHADTIYHGGVIITVNDAQPGAEAIAIADGKIQAVGTKSDVEALQSSATKMVNLDGKALLPGFVDAHGHAYMVGIQASSANLLPPPDGDVNGIDTLVDTLKQWADENSGVVDRVGWIVGFGYDDSQLKEQRHPTRDDLDRISTDVPVIVIHQSGHLGAGNSKALAMSGIDASTDDPKGGVFRRREGSQEPNGVAEEYAFFKMLAGLIGNFDQDVNEALVVEGTRLLASFGYTTAQEGRAMGPALAAMERVAGKGKLAIDLVTYPDVLEVDDISPSSEYQNRFRVAGGKLTIDGSPQGKTAWLTEPYKIPPPGQQADYRGYPAITEERVMKSVQEAFADNYQILVHANGDAAIDVFIRAVREAREKYPDVNKRPVLVHGQTLRKDQVAELDELGIFPSLFPMHTFYWGDWHRESVLGAKRADNISPTGWVLERGMRFSSHHDAPVALPDSMRVLSATVIRRSRSGDILGPEHRVPRATAIKAMTLWPAWQHFEEESKGSLEVGKRADLVILSGDPLTVPEAELASLKILETIKDGQTVYRRESPEKALRPAAFGSHVATLPPPSFQPLMTTGRYGADGCLNPALHAILSALGKQKQ